MARYRVKAYFMHESEEAAAKKAVDDSLLESPEWTPGYVMGVVDEADIAKLSEDGLVVTPIEEVSSLAPGKKRAGATEIATLAGTISTRFNTASLLAPTGTKGAKRGVRPAVPNKPPKAKILSENAKQADFYVIRCHGSLTVARRAALDKLRIEFSERLSRNKYKAYLKPSQVAPLAALDFIDWLRIYDSGDTLRDRSTATQKGATGTRAVKRAAPRRTAIYAVRLHRAKDLKVVRSWLSRRNRKPLWVGEDILHVGLPADGGDVRALAELPEVCVVEEIRPTQLFDEFAVKILGLPTLHTPPAGSGLSGKGEIIGIADTGIDDSHTDFAGRIKKIIALGRPPNDASDPEGHGTHVAGCAAGDGQASQGKVVGAAPKADIVFQSVLDPNGGLGGLPRDLATLFQQAYDHGVRIHNNSWGAFAFARYATSSLQVDRFVAEKPDMLVIIAAGNDGIGTPRTKGATMNAKPGFVDWPCVAAPATSKNGLTVGASRSSRTSGGFSRLKWSDAWQDRYPHDPVAAQTISGDDQAIAAFSSRGPSDDQRIKPDVVAPGTDIAAARSKDAPLHKFWGAYPKNDKYGFMGGTSMAAPYVAGCAALVREWYRTQKNYATPSAALIKATLINGTQRITGADAQAEVSGDPNFHQGFGRIDMASTLPNHANSIKLAFEDQWSGAAGLKHEGDRARFRIDVGAGAPLRICLVWTDPPARSLQNSLVLLVDNGPKHKWVGNAQAASLLKVSGGVPDPNNNVQVVRLPNPKAGAYTVVVTASNVLVPPQTFALVITGDLVSDLKRLP